MAKVNKALAAKKARQGSLYYGGNTGIGARDYVSHYSQGHEAYQNGERLSTAWHRHKMQGWRNALEADKKFLAQMKAKYNKTGEQPSDWVLDRIVTRMAVAAQAA